MNKYFLKTVGNHRLREWMWRFDADTHDEAVAMSVEQLSILGDCRWVTGAILHSYSGLTYDPNAIVKVFQFDVSQRVVVMEAG